MLRYLTSAAPLIKFSAKEIITDIANDKLTKYEYIWSCKVAAGVLEDRDFNEISKRTAE